MVDGNIERRVPIGAQARWLAIDQGRLLVQTDKEVLRLEL